MKINLSQRIHISTILILSCIVVITGIITVYANSHFSESIFYIFNDKYKIESEQDNRIIYHAKSAPSIEVQINESNRILLINKEKYEVHKVDGDHTHTFEVIYPNGHEYKVEDYSGFLMSYDKNGEMVPELSSHFESGQIVMSGEELYFPTSLVTAAYPEFHTKQGNPILFILSFVLLLYGWCGYRYKKFQHFMFFISLNWIWVKDPEPNDFYYRCCKVGGIIVMIYSLLLALKSLEL